MSTNRIGFSNDFVLKNEKIGMGTADPLQILHVQGNLLVALGTDTTKHITLNPYETNNGTLSWEGSAGQLFSITNNLTEGSIFSVNDVSGIPSIDVDADGTISLAPLGGNVGIGTTSPGVALHVNGDIRCDGVYGETDTNTSIQFPGSDVITFNEGGSEAARIDSSGRLGLGTSSPQERLDIDSGRIKLTNNSIIGYIGSPIAGAFQIAIGSGDLTFHTSGYTERLRITSNGYARLASATGGIQFNGDTAAANALDDYEEGTWTPTVTAGSFTGGSYTKIGNRVIATAYVASNGGGTITISTITGLPFNVGNSWAAVGAGSWYLASRNGGAYYDSGQCFAKSNSTTILLSSAINRTSGGFEGGDTFSVTVIYYV